MEKIDFRHGATFVNVMSRLTRHVLTDIFPARGERNTSHDSLQLATADSYVNDEACSAFPPTVSQMMTK